MGSGAGEELRVGVAVRPVLGVLESLRSLLDDLDPGQLPARDAMDLVTVLDRVGRVADAGKMSAALRVADSSLWKKTGKASPADWLAATAGIGVGDAVRALKTAQVVADAPETRDALARGDVSPRQAAAVAKVEKLSPDKARALLADAPRKSAKELESDANRIVAAESGETDAEKTERHHRARSLTTGIDDEGMGWGHWRLPPAAHARLLAQLDSARNDIFTAARRDGAREPSAAYTADALVKVFDRAEQNRGGPAAAGDVRDGDRPGEGGPEDWSFAKVIVRVDATALDRGEMADGEVCEIAGQGPIPVADAWKIIDGDAFVAAIATRGTDITKLVHLGRTPTALQRTALEWLSAGECSVEGCTSKARLEIDHIADWADTHRTELGQIAWPCGHCHDLKTHHRWTWGPQLPNGKRPLLPPEGTATDHDARTGPEPPEEPAATAAPPHTADPPPADDAPTVSERAQMLADRARSQTAHPSGRRSTRRAAPGQDGLFDTG